MNRCAPGRALSAALLLVACGGLPACTSALFSVVSFRSHETYTDAAVVTLVDQHAQGPLTKTQVLRSLGPPVHVLGQESGEIFVYRRLARDTTTVNLNPGAVLQGAPSVPVYYNSDVSGRDDVFMIFFDRLGAVRGIATHAGIEEVGGSTAASVGQGFQDIFE